MLKGERLSDGVRLRREHWNVAESQGKTVAANLLGDDQPHRTVPYFWSDLSDWVTSEYLSATPAGSDREILRGDPGSGSFSMWYLRNGRVTVVLAVNRSGELEFARQLIELQQTVPDATLADEFSSLNDLVSQQSKPYPP